jgi:hypothetical protein
MSRPEEIAPPELVRHSTSPIHTSTSSLPQFYGDTEAQKYTAK